MTSSLVTYEDLAKMKKEILQASAPASIVKEVNASTKFRRLLSADMAIGRALTGPQFIDTVAIEDGAITAAKLVAELVLSTTIIAGAASPADRLVLDSTGLEAFGTVSAVPNTSTLKIDTDGDFRFGTGATAITYTASTGTLVVPAATISGLTIAAVGTGNIGGTYSSNSGNPKIEFSPTQLRMTNGSGVNVFSLNASTGVFTLSDSPSGADRMDITNGSLSIYRSSVREFYLAAGGASNTVEMLLTGGGAGQYVGMNAVDGLWLGASTFAGASTKFRVSPAGVLDAASATISGAITATSGDLQTLGVSGTLTLGASGILKTSATTTRVELDSTGLYGYNAGTARFQVLNNGSGFLGASSTFSWSSAGVVTAGGFTIGSSLLSSGSAGSYVTVSSGATAFSAGGATPATAPFNVTSGGALSATSATLSGALTATSLSITGTASFSGGTLTLPNGGSITSSAVNITGNSGGSNGNIDNMNVASLTVDGTITLGSGGSIVDADGSTWAQSGITLVSAGTYGDAIKWQQSGSNTGSVFATTSAMVIRGDPTTGGTLELFPSEVILRYDGTNTSLQLQSTNRRALFAGYVYPGSGSATQTSRYISDNGTYLNLQGPVNIGNATTGGSNANWSSFGTANIPDQSAAYVVVYVNGTAYRIPLYGNA